MSFTLGLYEVFAYSLPGGAYAALLVYVANRFGWLPQPLPFQGEAGISLLVLAGVSYALGHLAYGAGRWLEREVRPRLAPRRRRAAGTRVERNRARFLARCPQAAGRPFLDVNHALLLAAVQLLNRDAAAEVERINVGAMMLRSLAPPAFAAAVVAVVEAVVTGRPGVTGLAAALAATGTACWLLYDQRARWAEHKVYEFAFWLPEIDAALATAKPAPNPR